VRCVGCMGCLFCGCVGGGWLWCRRWVGCGWWMIVVSALGRFDRTRYLSHFFAMAGPGCWTHKPIPITHTHMHGSTTFRAQRRSGTCLIRRRTSRGSCSGSSRNCTGSWQRYGEGRGGVCDCVCVSLCVSVCLSVCRSVIVSESGLVGRGWTGTKALRPTPSPPSHPHPPNNPPP
jgi:hypothetical protein